LILPRDCELPVRKDVPFGSNNLQFSPEWNYQVSGELAGPRP